MATRPDPAVPTVVGPHDAMPPEHLPPEIWHLIIMALDDYCFVWFVLRQVSPFLASVTEDLFARYIFRTCSVRFAGQTLRDLLPPDRRQGPRDPDTRRIFSVSPNEIRTHWASFRSLQSPTFRFQPSTFAPAKTKARLILKLRDPDGPQGSVPLCSKQAEVGVSNNRLVELFFHSGADADANRVRLSNEPHFVRFFDQLRSIRIPSLIIDATAQDISLDWRQLCDTFLRDEFKCRFQANSLGSWSTNLRQNNR